jgi:hypothetical protein
MCVTAANLARGMRGLDHQVHSLAVQGSPAPPLVTRVTETPFAHAELSASEFT